VLSSARVPSEADYPPLPRPRIVERIRVFWQGRELGRRWEAWRPRALGLLAAAVAARAGLQHTSVTAIVTGVLPIALTVTAILAGFVTTAQSMLLVLMDRPVVARLRASGHFEPLVGYFREVVRSMACFIAVAISVLVLDACGVRLLQHDRLVPAALAGCFIWVCFSGLRMNRLMLKLLLHKDGTPPAA
jgi:hypothetical protein